MSLTPPPLDLAELWRAARTPPLPPPAPGRRMVVLGSSGAGKSTLANTLAQRLELDRIELDAEFWLPDWQQRPDAELRARVTARLDAAHDTGWVVDGNYRSRLAPIIWPRTDTFIWLDYGLGCVLQRVVRRSIRRVRDRELLWGTNRESLAKLLSRDSIVRWSLTTWAGRRLEYADALDDLPAHQQLIQLRSPRETEHWLASRLAPTASQ